MSAFFQLFYRYPNANWKYALAYEPGLMTEENYKVFVEAMKGGPYTGWIKRMTPKDRLVLDYDVSTTPTIAQLQWRRYSSKFWFGRLPQ
jgi:hypothetical protein